MQHFDYSIRVYKEYFNFASSHFLIFDDGTREPLHGHNYRVKIHAKTPELKQDMVFDFLDIKPIVRRVCDSLDHRLLIAKEHPQIQIHDQETHYKIIPPDQRELIVPKDDVLLLPILNTSAERIAHYLCHRILEEIKQDFHFSFPFFEVEVEETKGQSAIYQFQS